ncbi:MAG: protein kinase [Deltaproteobacteria bacterium]|nr:protein kinase [Deltaproteobacteria bacterium]
MCRIRHENVIKIYEVVLDQYGREWVIMERAYETLNEAVQRYGPWNDGFVARRGIELLSALEEVHYSDIVHRDVHIDNVLLTDWKGNQEPSIKLTDFGISKLLDENNHGGYAFTKCGRVFDVAPELVRLIIVHSFQSDVYQAGLCMYYMATGRAAVGPADGRPGCHHLRAACPATSRTAGYAAGADHREDATPSCGVPVPQRCRRACRPSPLLVPLQQLSRGAGRWW